MMDFTVVKSKIAFVYICLAKLRYCESYLVHYTLLSFTTDLTISQMDFTCGLPEMTTIKCFKGSHGEASLYSKRKLGAISHLRVGKLKQRR